MKFILLLIGLIVINQNLISQSENPLLQKFDTPFGVPPFDQIKEEHFIPAFEEAMKLHNTEIEHIINGSRTATFSNTIEALEYSGELLNRISSIFYNLNGANTNPKMQEIAKEIAPKLSKHYDNINLNEELFGRIKFVYNNKESYNLTPEQNKLLDEYYKNFVRRGALLNPEQKKRLREINEKLSLLTLQFGENNLNETNTFELVIDDEKDLAGLNDDIIKAAKEEAESRGYKDKWVFMIHKPSMIPFLQYSERRDLREILYKGYINLGDNNNEFDNKKIIPEIVALRLEKANLLGYKTHANFVLDDCMAKTPEKVYEFLNQLWKPALQRAKNELKEMQEIIDREGGNFKLEPWDWWYYAEKLKKEKYDLNDEILRPYFEINNVLQGAFMVANKLYGITFTERFDIPKYHPDVRTFEVKEADGKHIGIFYCDYYPRASKNGGAWMNSFRKQYIKNDEYITPVISNVGNFTKPTSEKPSMLTLDEVLTLFHELGHGLHGLLSDSRYPTISGTAVPRDFVELPSQIMENWAVEPEVLKMYAKHYKTGEAIPQELIDKIQNAKLFNQGFETVEYLAASFLDMDYHTITSTDLIDVTEFENNSLNKIGLIPEIISRYRSTYFRHIFSGGYSAGYYSYIWAEVLDSDAFQAFKETSLFNQEYAKLFRENILAKGGSDEPMNLYIKFRGRETKIDALLKKRGLE